LSFAQISFAWSVPLINLNWDAPIMAQIGRAQKIK
jgi:hypothetical protein